MFKAAGITPDGEASFAGVYGGGENASLCLAAASYFGGRMYDVDFDCAENISPGGYVNLHAKVDIPENGNAKYFLLDSLRGLRPVNVEG